MPGKARPRQMVKSQPPRLPHKRGSAGAVLDSIALSIFVPHCCQLPSSSLRRNRVPHRLACASHPHLPFSATMPPKSGVSKEASRDAEKKAAVAKMRRENVVFPPTLKVNDLTEKYSYMWGKKTKDHDAAEVLPATCPAGDDKFPFFTAYLYCRLVPPFSDFFDAVMRSYGFRLFDFAPNAVTCMSIFVHLCENFVGIVPNVPLFRHFYAPRIEGDALSGSVTWISKPGMKERYLEGKFHTKWLEWRSEWCWIKQKDFPDYCIPRTERIQRNPRWTDVGPHDDKLDLALDRIFNLRADSLTIEMVGADFLCRRIAPLQQRGRQAWEYKNAADMMRLYPGLPNNLTVLEHNWLICRLFNKGCNHALPETVFPLCNNTARDSILAMMPACNAQGLEATWQQPKDAIVEEWFNNLVETPRRMEDDLIHPTKENELEYIAERAEAARGAGSSRITGGDTEEEEEEDEQDNAGERGGEKPLAPPALKRAAAAPSTSKRSCPEETGRLRAGKK